jgi:hypothetical protein
MAVMHPFGMDRLLILENGCAARTIEVYLSRTQGQDTPVRRSVNAKNPVCREVTCCLAGGVA